MTAIFTNHQYNQGNMTNLNMTIGAKSTRRSNIHTIQEPVFQKLRSIRSVAILLIMVFIFISSPALSQDKYSRKSVSYVPVAALLSDFVKTPEFERDVFAEEMHIKLGRWDANVLPESIIEVYRKKVASNIDNVDSLNSIIEETIVSKIVNILSDVALDRAKTRLDEADEQIFMATKAKELGITTEDLLNVMNSAYIAIPYISKYQSEKTKTGLRYSLTGGLAWYQIHFSDASVYVSFVGNVSHSGSGSAAKREAYYDKNGKKRTRGIKKELVRRRGMASATSAIANRVRLKTQDLESFRLLTPIAEVKGNLLGFELGGDDDVKLNDKYNIVEYILRDDGTTISRKIGFGFVSSPSDSGSGQLSWLKVVNHRKRLVKGMSISEHPRRGYDFRAAWRVKQAHLSSGWLSSEGIDFYSFPDPQDFNLDFLNVGWSFNAARSTGVSQLFYNADIFATVSSTPGERPFNDELSDNELFIMGGSLSASRKFYWGAFAYGLEGGAAVLIWRSSTFIPDSANLDIASMSYDKVIAAIIANISLEYALTIDFNIGVSAGYWQEFTKRDKWKLGVRSVGDEEAKEVIIDNSDRPKLDFSGLEAKVYFTLSFL